MLTENEISSKVLKAAIEVHKELGPGLLEAIYENCLAFELKEMGLKVKQQEPLPVIYKGNVMDFGYRLDLLIEDKIIVEVKAVEKLNDVHLAQLLTYLKLTKNKLGLLINFNESLLKKGVRRVINGKMED